MLALFVLGYKKSIFATACQIRRKRSLLIGLYLTQAIVVIIRYYINIEEKLVMILIILCNDEYNIKYEAIFNCVFHIFIQVCMSAVCK